MDVRQRLRALAEGGGSTESAESVHTQSSVRQRLRALAEGGGSTEPADPALRRAAQPVQNAPKPETAAMEQIKGWQNTKKAESDPARTTNKIVLGSQIPSSAAEKADGLPDITARDTGRSLSSGKTLPLKMRKISRSRLRRPRALPQRRCVSLRATAKITKNTPTAVYM